MRANLDEETPGQGAAMSAVVERVSNLRVGFCLRAWFARDQLWHEQVGDMLHDGWTTRSPARRDSSTPTETVGTSDRRREKVARR